MAQWVRRPLTRTGGENLERIATQLIGTLSRILHPTRAGRMNADAPRGYSGWALWESTHKNSLLTRHGTWHARSIATDSANIDSVCNTPLVRSCILCLHQTRRRICD